MRKIRTDRCDRVSDGDLATALEWLFAWMECDELPMSTVATWLTGRFHMSGKEADLLLKRALTSGTLAKDKEGLMRFKGVPLRM